MGTDTFGGAKTCRSEKHSKAPLSISPEQNPGFRTGCVERTDLRITAGNIALALGCNDKQFIAEITRSWGPFVSCRRLRKLRGRQKQEVPVDITVTNQPSLKNTLTCTTIPSGNKIRLANRQLSGHFDLLNEKAQVVLAGGNKIETLGNFLRNIYTILFLRQQGLVLHACGIVRNGQAYIFIGPSGAGKTTIAELSSDYDILGDDNVFIRETGGSFAAFAIPNHGDMTRLSSVGQAFSIKGLFYLVKDKEVYLRKIAAPWALAKFLTIPNLPTEQIAFWELLGRFKRLIDAVGCFELHFLPDNSFWRCIDGYYKLMPQQVKRGRLSDNRQ